MIEWPEIEMTLGGTPRIVPREILSAVHYCVEQRGTNFDTETAMGPWEIGTDENLFLELSQ